MKLRAGNPAPICTIAPIRQELAALDREVPLGGATLSTRVDDAFRRVRVAGTLVRYARELAIRAALGAEREIWRGSSSNTV